MSVSDSWLSDRKFAFVISFDSVSKLRFPQSLGKSLTSTPCNRACIQTYTDIAQSAEKLERQTINIYGTTSQHVFRAWNKVWFAGIVLIDVAVFRKISADVWGLDKSKYSMFPFCRSLYYDRYKSDFFLYVLNKEIE